MIKRMIALGMILTLIATFSGCSSDEVEVQGSSAPESPVASFSDSSEEETLDSTSSSSSSAASAASSSTSSATKKPSTASSTAKKPSTSSTTSSTAKKPSSTASSSTAATPAAFTLPTASQLQVVADEITRLTNNYRAQNNLPAFKTHSLLDKAAGIRGKELLISYNAGHTRPDGSECPTVLTEVGLDDTPEFINREHFGACSENISYYLSYEPVVWTNSVLKEWAYEMFIAWKNSGNHNAHMLSTNLEYMGVGCAAKISTTKTGKQKVSIYGEQLFTD